MTTDAFPVTMQPEDPRCVDGSQACRDCERMGECMASQAAALREVSTGVIACFPSKQE